MHLTAGQQLCAGHVSSEAMKACNKVIIKVMHQGRKNALWDATTKKKKKERRRKREGEGN